MADLGKLVAEAAVMAAVCGGGLLALWWVKRKPGPTARSARPDASVRAMGDLLAELKRTSDSMAASLDRRAADLRALIAEADKRLALLEAAPTPVVPPARPVSGPPSPGDDVAPDLKAMFGVVYAKADEGKPVTEIARDTGLSKGSVQLILGLRDLQRSSDGPPAASPSRG